jgi:hypothetical protein
VVVVSLVAPQDLDLTPQRSEFKQAWVFFLKHLYMWPAGVSWLHLGRCPVGWALLGVFLVLQRESIFYLQYMGWPFPRAKFFFYINYITLNSTIAFWVMSIDMWSHDHGKLFFLFSSIFVKSRVTELIILYVSLSRGLSSSTRIQIGPCLLFLYASTALWYVFRGSCVQLWQWFVLIEILFRWWWINLTAPLQKKNFATLF